METARGTAAVETAAADHAGAVIRHTVDPIPIAAVGTIAAMRSRTLLIAAGLTAALAAAAGCAPADDDTATPAASGGSASPGTAKCARRTSRRSPRASSRSAPTTRLSAVVQRQQAGERARASRPPSRTRSPTKLGYTKDQVDWTRVTFNNAIAPGPKTYDFDINEFSITEERKKAVDFSVAVLRRDPDRDHA